MNPPPHAEPLGDPEGAEGVVAAAGGGKVGNARATDVDLVGILSTLDAPTLTKADLAELLFERIGLNKRESKDMVDAFFDALHAALVSGGDVKIAGFGNFSIRRKAARPGRNPRTGESIPIAARNVVVFHASQKLKALVQALPASGTNNIG